MRQFFYRCGCHCFNVMLLNVIRMNCVVRGMLFINLFEPLNELNYF